FAKKYNAALQSYLAHGQEANLERAYDLGRKAVANGLGLLKLTKLHLDAVGEIVCARPQLTNDGDTSRAAQTFLLEALSPFEATHRGFRETNRKLLQLNKTLSRRNTELGMMNRSLKNEVLERKRTEKALRESEVHYRILFS